MVITVLEGTPQHFVHQLLDQCSHLLPQPLHVLLSAPTGALVPGGALAFLRNYPLAYPGLVTLVPFSYASGGCRGCACSRLCSDVKLCKHSVFSVPGYLERWCLGRN